MRGPISFQPDPCICLWLCEREVKRSMQGGVAPREPGSPASLAEWVKREAEERHGAEMAAEWDRGECFRGVIS